MMTFLKGLLCSLIPFPNPHPKPITYVISFLFLMILMMDGCLLFCFKTSKVQATLNLPNTSMIYCYVIGLLPYLILFYLSLWYYSFSVHELTYIYLLIFRLLFKFQKGEE